MKTQTQITFDLNRISTENSYVAFFTNYDIPNGSETMANRNKLAKVSTTNEIMLNQVLINFTLETGDANCPSKTVVSDVANSTTSLKLNSVTGLSVGDRIEIVGFTDNKITAINTGTNFITLAFALPSIPSPGTIARIKISQIGLIRGGDSSLSTGEINQIEQFILFKDSTMTKSGTITIK